MKYRIRFTEGKLAGEIFAISGNTVSIGRSHSNDIKVDVPDVSGKHVIINVEDRGITLDNLSSKRTLLDGVALEMGGHYDFLAGQCVTMGNETAFVLEALPNLSDDEKTTFPETGDGVAYQNTDDAETVLKSSDEGKTVIPDSVAQEVDVIENNKESIPEVIPQYVIPESSSSEEQTIAMQTRMASAEELEYLRGKHQKQRNRKIFTYGIVITAVVVAFIVLYWTVIYREPEKFVSWPKNSQGQDVSELVILKDTPLKNDIALEYPLVKGTSVKHSAGRVEVFTCLGKYHDVPFRMILEYSKNKTSLSKDRVSFFEEWISRKTKGSENWNFDFIRPLDFYMTDHGIPYLNVSYSRTVNNESYFGFAVLIRYMDWSFILLKEVPMRERWRAEQFIQKVCFFQFSDRFLMNHWEGMKEFYSGTAEDNIVEAKALLMRRSPSIWEKAEYLLRSALCKIHLSGGKESARKEAETLLRSLRNSQIEWFNAQKIAFFLAKNKRHNKEMNQVRETLKAVFSSEEDLRFHKIRQNKWN